MRSLLLALVLVAACLAQEPVASVVVSVSPPGATYYVDGKPYHAPQAFLWSKGSKHILSVEPIQFPLTINSQYAFQTWSDSTGALNATPATIPVTADPSIKWFKAVMKVFHRVDVILPHCTQSACGNPPGTVEVNDVAYTYTSNVFLEAGTEVTLRGYPADGYLFQGWMIGGTPVSAFVTKFMLAQPLVLSPVFLPARRVSLITSPPELSVTIDRTPTVTPNVVDWAAGRAYLVGAQSPQSDRRSGLWVFDKWDFGGGQNSTYTIDPTRNEDTVLTALFVRGIRASFLTEPFGLRIAIDGRDNWPGYNFVWGAGTSHTLSAAKEQLDSRGRRWVFRGWSNEGAASQTVTAGEQDMRLIAKYERLDRLTIDSSPRSLTIEADGSPCRTPCVLDRERGTAVQIVVPAAIALGADSRLELSGSAKQIVELSGDAQASFTYRTMHRLTTGVSPESGATVECIPESADGFFPAGTPVSIAVAPQPGHRFLRWGGDAAGTFQPAYVSMTGPRSIRALLEKVPWVPPAGVRNAAGETPEAVVAAGSIVAITGVHLGTQTARAASNPLPQTLGGQIVMLGDRILPLVSVAPDRVEVLIPSGIEGIARLTLSSGVATEATVVRNAPGLYAEILREDGSRVTVENPAAPGELLTLSATGIGPLALPWLDGFAVTADIPLIDTVEAVAGEEPLVVESAKPSRTEAGKQTIRVRAPAITAGLRLRVNDRYSNTIDVPVGDVPIR